MENTTLHKVSRVALVAGMVILAVFAVIGAVRLVPNTFSTLGSALDSIKSTLFSPKENIVISFSNNAVASGEETHLSFEHRGKTSQGSYRFYFDCKGDNISMTIIDGVGRKTATCGSKTNISKTDFGVIPLLANKNSFLDVNIYIDYIKNDTNIPSVLGRSVLTIRNGNLSQPQKDSNNTVINIQKDVATSTVNNTNVLATSTQNTQNINVVQKADLYIIAKDMGVLVNGVFIPNTSFSYGEMPVVRFDVGNQGNIPTGTWLMNVNLPTSPSQVFTSPVQPSLKPGDIIEYSLSLANLAHRGNNLMTVTLDPVGLVNELTKSNNTLEVTLIGN